VRRTAYPSLSVLWRGESSREQVLRPLRRAAQDRRAGLDELIAVGDGGPLLVSSDGMTWTTQTSPTDEELFAITYGSRGFVAVAGVETIESRRKAARGVWVTD
jgi:hypothetical protein